MKPEIERVVNDKEYFVVRVDVQYYHIPYCIKYFYDSDSMMYLSGYNYSEYNIFNDTPTSMASCKRKKIPNSVLEIAEKVISRMVL